MRMIVLLMAGRVGSRRRHVVVMMVDHGCHVTSLHRTLVYSTVYAADLFMFKKKELNRVIDDGEKEVSSAAECGPGGI